MEQHPYLMDCGIGDQHPGHSQVAVSGSASTNIGGSRTTQEFLEHLLQFCAFNFCSLVGEGKKEKRREKKLLSGGLVWQLAATVPGLLVMFFVLLLKANLPLYPE
jgi:hypothetical protein